MAQLMVQRVDDLTTTFRKSLKQSAADLLAQDWFNEYTITFAQPINTTTEEAIRRLIEQGVSEGWSVPTTMKHLESLFTQWMTGTLTAAEFEWLNQRMPEWRRELVTRTETIKALNVISYRLFGMWGVTQKEWLATADNRTRPDHRAVDGQIVPINEPFNVGGWAMQYPGDPAGPPEEVINCRCTLLPIL